MNYIKSLLTTGITLFYCQLIAQPTLIWTQNIQHTVSPGFSNEARKIATDSNGNTYMLADATSDIDQAGAVVGTTQHYVVLRKYDASGMEVGNKPLFVQDHIQSGYDNLGAFGLEIDANNNVYVGYNIYNSITNFNIIITKYNSNLARQYSCTFNPASIDQGIDLKVSPSGNAFAIVKSNLAGTIQYHIFKADSGVTATTTPFKSFNANTEGLKSMAIDQNNDIYVAGYQLNNGFQSILTAKVNTVAALKWQRTYNNGTTNRDDSGNKIALGPAQEVYVVGTSDRSTPTGFDAVVLKYFSANGRQEWVCPLDYNNGTDAGFVLDCKNPNQIYVGSVSANNVLINRIEPGRGIITGKKAYAPVPDAGFSVIDSVKIIDIQSSPNQNIYISGNVFAKDNSSRNFNAYFLAKYVPVTGRYPIDQAFKTDFAMPVDGDFTKSKRIAGVSYDFSSGRCLVLTDFAETHLSRLNEAVLVQAYDFPLPMRNTNFSNELPNGLTDVEVFPLPASDKITIVNTEEISNVALYDLAGKQLSNSQSIFSNTVEFPLLGIYPGTYLVKITTINGDCITKKVIKE